MVKKTQIEMIADRGYDITKEEWLLDEDNDKKYMKKFKQMTLNHRYKKQDNSIYVMYVEEDDELILEMRKFKTKMENTTTGIIIANTAQLKKLKKNIYDEYMDPLKQIQLFDYEELAFNLTKHIFSPTYEAIDKALIIPSIVHASQLPILRRDDPAVKYYGWQPGQVIKIIDNHFYTDMLTDYDISYCIVSSKL